MKKTLCVLCAVICLLSLSLSSCSKEDYVDQIEVGMTLDEYYAIVPEDIRHSLLNYEFFATADGRIAIVKFSIVNQRKVLDISVVEEGTPTADNFAKVKEGMTFVQLVETIGAPGEPYTSGIVSVMYVSQDGKKCDVNIGNKIIGDVVDLTNVDTDAFAELYVLDVDVVD